MFDAIEEKESLLEKELRAAERESKWTVRFALDVC